VEPHHFTAALAPGKNFDAAPASAIGTMFVIFLIFRFGGRAIGAGVASRCGSGSIKISVTEPEPHGSFGRSGSHM
jgi:hypothetical protein